MVSAQAPFSPFDCGLVLDQVTDAVVVLDRQWRFLYLNAAGEKLSGMNRSQVLGRNTWELFPESVGTESHRQYHRAMAEQIPVEFEDFFPTFNIWVEVRAFPTPQSLTILVRDITHRKQVEDALRDSEERFRATFEQAAVGMVHGDFGGQGLRCNRKFCDMIGYSADELASLNLRDITYPEDLPQSVATVRELGQGTRESASLRKRYVRKDGAVFWAVTTLSLARCSSGKPAYTIAVIEDITDQHRIQESLRDSERRYRFLTENMKDVVWVLDTQTLCFNYLSPSVQRLRGYTAEEIMAVPVHQALTSQGTDELLARLRSRVEAFLAGMEGSDKYSTDEVEQPCKDGSTVWTEAITALHLNPKTGHVELHGVTRDISQRKRAEESLRKSEERFRQAMDATSDGLWDWNVQTNEVYYSPSYWGMLGYAPDELYGQLQSWLEHIHPDDRQRALAANQDCIENRKPDFEIEFRMRTKDGRWKWILGRGKAILRDAQGRAIRMIGTHVDITERREAQESLRQLNEQLEHRVGQRNTELAELEATINRGPLVVFRRENSPGFPVIFVTENINQFGFRADDIRAGRIDRKRMVHPGDLQRFQAEMAQYMRDGVGEFTIHLRFVTPAGEIRWVEDREMAVRNAQGIVTHYDGVVMDITERKMAEERLQESQRHFAALAEHNHRLARELQHRVRNSIQGLIGLVSVLRSRMTDVQAFANAMESRLMALGHIQRMLSDTNWGQVDLCQLVTSTLAAMQSLAPRDAALAVQGPAVLIGPDQVTPLVLIFAEWFTNSCKYGAHTSPNGQVDIGWRLAHPDALPRQLHLSWTETGGPPITTSITRSLGTELVDSFATRELHGRVCLSYPPQGARHSLFFPLP